MGGVELTDRGLVVERAPNVLDTLAIDFSAILDEIGIRHVFVAGYVAILCGRPRATEDIDVLIEHCSEAEVDALVEELDSRDYWGPAMPLEEMYDNLASGTNIWVAPRDQMSPHLEVKFTSDEFDRASLTNAIDAHISGQTIPIGPLELQIAYKLSLGSRTDLEDAAHLYTLFGESLTEHRLQHWVDALDVDDRYERLKTL